MKKNYLKWSICLLGALSLLSTAVFALEEGDVESAIAASSKAEVAGNVFVWFLCAIAFLKISQKIDSFMASLGINVGRTGGSMMSELLIAGRALGIAGKSVGGAIGNIFNRSSSSSSTTAAGEAFTGTTHGVFQSIQKKAGNAAAANATGNGTGVSNFIGGAMLNNSIHKGGQFATEVIGAVATGNISTVGSITGDKAAEALSCYLGYSAQERLEQAAESTVERVDEVRHVSGDGTVVTLNGGSTIPQGVPTNADAAATAAARASLDQGSTVDDTAMAQTGGQAPANGGTADDAQTQRGNAGSAEPSSIRAGNTPVPTSRPTSLGAAGSAPQSTAANPVPAQAPTFRNIEIGGGRITGYETPAGGGEERQFAMYNATQYMEPVGKFETVETADGESWYKQYAEPTVEKTPYRAPSGKIEYNERIVEQLPQIPKRKDRV